jgi:hypothetical protein
VTAWPADVSEHEREHVAHENRAQVRKPSSRMQKNGVKGSDLLVLRHGEGCGTAPLGVAHRCTLPALVRSSRGLGQVPDADQVVDR